MSVSAQLKIDAFTLRLFKMIRLMIEHNGVKIFVDALRKFVKSFAMSICSVVSSNDIDSVYCCSRVTQERNSSVFIKLFAVLFASNIFVISKTSIDRRLDISKLLCHILFPKWAQVAINNITTNQHKVWLFVVNQLHPAFKLLFSVVISQVNIANHHYLLRLRKLLLCG